VAERSRHAGLARFAAAATVIAVVQVAVAGPASAQVVDQVGGWVFDTAAERATAWVLGAFGFFAEGVLGFLGDSSTPDVTAAWFQGPGSPFATVRSVAVVGLVGFALAGIASGAIAGDVAGMVRRIAVGLPASVVGMMAATAVTAKVVALVDALSAVILDPAGADATRFLQQVTVPAAAATGGFAALVVGVVGVLAALAVWVELLVRAALIYLLVALTPLAFAAILWPPARGAARRLVELLAAVILSKLVVAVALSVGVAALTGPLEATGPDGSSAATTGGLVVAVAVLGLAAFAPFVVLRLVPIAEGAVVAAGISRGPARAATTAVGYASTTASVTRLAGPARAAGGGPSAVASFAGPTSLPSSAPSPRVPPNPGAAPGLPPPSPVRSSRLEPPRA
jgi:hypothetical protein